MDFLPAFEQYRRRRLQIFERFNEIRSDLDDWLDIHETLPLSQSDLGNLQLLYHNERVRFLTELGAAADSFIRELVETQPSLRPIESD